MTITSRLSINNRLFTYNHRTRGYYVILYNLLLETKRYLIIKHPTDPIQNACLTTQFKIIYFGQRVFVAHACNFTTSQSATTRCSFRSRLQPFGLTLWYGCMNCWTFRVNNLQFDRQILHKSSKSLKSIYWNNILITIKYIFNLLNGCVATSATHNRRESANFLSFLFVLILRFWPSQL